MKSKVFLLIRMCLLLAATIVAGSLFFMGRSSTPAEQATVIIIDVQQDMLTPDVETKVPGDFITRLDASKKIIQRIIAEYPQRSFGLITYGSEIDYLIPATLDSGTLLQYVTSLLASDKINIEEKRKGGTEEWSTGFIAALQGKNIIILGDVKLPKTLLKNAQIIPLDTYKTFNPENSLTRQHVNISTVQTQWLIIILCLLVILSI